MSETVMCDGRGRLVLPKDVRERYGDEFHVVRMREEVVLIPVPKNPLQEIAALGKKAGVARFSLKQLKTELRKQLMKEL